MGILVWRILACWVRALLFMLLFLDIISLLLLLFQLFLYSLYSAKLILLPVTPSHPAEVKGLGRAVVREGLVIQVHSGKKEADSCICNLDCVETPGRKYFLYRHFKVDLWYL